VGVPSPTVAAGRRLPSLTVTTIRRTIKIGWLYFVLGIGFSLFLAAVLALSPRASTAFDTTFPLEVPLFGILGSIGGLMTFTSDRTKGVFEYLIAYGVPPRRLFLNGLAAAVAMAGAVLGLELAVGIGLASARGLALTTDFWMTVAYYSVPMALAGAGFIAAVGMIWAAVSTPRTGMNSPVGFAPMIGIGPTVLILVVAEAAPANDFFYVTGGGALLMVGAVVTLLVVSARLMGRERFLSPL
jgi:hypothetical protein